jgi:hypothetical protein
MTKNEQNRVVAWRLQILRQANDLPGGVAQTCRHFALSRKTLNGELGTRLTGKPADLLLMTGFVRSPRSLPSAHGQSFF